MTYRPPLRLVRTFSVALTVLATFGSGPMATDVRAQGDATVEIARQRFREGVEHYDQREYEKARLAFLQAYALKPHPSVLLNLAQSELRAGFPADAANHFAAYLRENPGATEAEKQEVELGFAAAKSKSGAVEIAVDVEGADILVNNEKKGRSPMEEPVYVMPGRHTIVAQSGSDRAQTSISVAAGDTVGATLRLRPPSGAAAVPAGGDTEPAARPAREEPWDDGGDVAVSTSGRRPFLQWFGNQPIAWVGAGLAGVGLGTGVTFALLSNSSYANAEETRARILVERDRDGFSDGPCDLSLGTRRDLGATRVAQYDQACAVYNDDVSAGDRQKVVSTVGFIAGGVFAAGTVLFYFVDPKAEAQARAPAPGGFTARVVPVLGPGAQGISVFGAF
jgi:hypothetical protein